jgi:hypothetical protein
MKAKNSPNLKLLLLLIPLFGVVAISGCTGTTSGPTFGNGVTILNWEPTFSSVESGDQLQLRIRVQNQGETTAQDVRAVLAGINPEDWGLGMGLQEPEIPFNDLLPPNRVQNTEGQTAQDTFDLTAPALPKGTTQQYSPLVRVFYHYKTTVIKSITLVNENELRRLQDQGKTLSSTDTKTSAGPLSVTITTGKFIKARESGSVFSKVFPITIVVTNVGGGVVSTQDVPKDDYLVDITNVQMPSRLSIVPGSCEEFDRRFLTLWKGQSASITCNVKIEDPPLANEDENIGITLEYDYYIDRTTTITVTGTEEGLFG